MRTGDTPIDTCKLGSIVDYTMSVLRKCKIVSIRVRGVTFVGMKDIKRVNFEKGNIKYTVLSDRISEVRPHIKNIEYVRNRPISSEQKMIELEKRVTALERSIV